jgi:hypothetical protein
MRWRPILWPIILMVYLLVTAYGTFSINRDRPVGALYILFGVLLLWWLI